MFRGSKENSGLREEFSAVHGGPTWSLSALSSKAYTSVISRELVLKGQGIGGRYPCPRLTGLRMLNAHACHTLY